MFDGNNKWKIFFYQNSKSFELLLFSPVCLAPTSLINYIWLMFAHIFDKHNS